MEDLNGLRLVPKFLSHLHFCHSFCFVFNVDPTKVLACWTMSKHVFSSFLMLSRCTLFVAQIIRAKFNVCTLTVCWNFLFCCALRLSVIKSATKLLSYGYVWLSFCLSQPLCACSDACVRVLAPVFLIWEVDRPNIRLTHLSTKIIYRFFNSNGYCRTDWLL